MFKNPVITLVFTLLLLFGSVSYAQDLGEGLGYYNSGNYKKAEVFFRKLLNNEPNNYSVKYMLAASLVNRKKYDEAKHLYKSVIANSDSRRLVSLSRTGLRNLGDYSDYTYNVTRAVININTAGSVMIINNVTLNDTLNANFVLDTGASFTTISTATASKLNISTQGAKKIKIMTGSGYVTAPLVKIPRIEVKGLVVKNVEAIVMNLPNYNSKGSQGVVGLLGLSFLNNFKFTVDKSRDQITLEKN